MNTHIIADASGLISLISTTDANHAAALRMADHFARIQGTVIVPGVVFAETLTVLGKKVSHEAALAAGETILATPTFLLTSDAEELQLRALALWRDQPGAVSFTDCLVMAFAEHYETLDIFGFDEVFHRSGYRAGSAVAT